ncbi:MAG: gamma-glutamyltransferase [Reyranellaceae bacterium]
MAQAIAMIASAVTRAILALALLTAWPAAARDVAVTARTQMVAAANPMAVDAGLQILRKGGSAVDAAVAVQMVLGVVEPQASGIGGGGLLLHYDARARRVTAWDGRETAPAAATETQFLDVYNKPLPFPRAVVSGLSVGVPGAVSMLEELHRRHGKLPWRDLFEPAIRLAADGFKVPPRLGRALANERALKDDAQARAIYFNDDGSPKKEGDVIRNPALAETMRLIAERGAQVLHRGPLADAIVAAVAREPRPGRMSAADLADYRALQRAPLCRALRDWVICGMGPPSSGPLAILQTLPLLDRAPAAVGEAGDAHRLAEASRLAFADRERYVGDPGFVPVPVDGLLDGAYLARRGSALRDDRVMERVMPGQPPGAPLPGPAASPAKPEGGTSHMAIVDRDGNAVSFTTTIESVFGARRMVGGFLLNNELTDFAAVPVVDDRPVANRVQPGKRPRSSMSPLIVTDRDGRFVLAIGSAGGSRIIGDVLQATWGALLRDLPLQDAIAARRIINRGGATEIEGRSDDEQAKQLAEALKAIGHKVVISPHQGGLHGIRARRSADGTLIGYEGGADPRRDGVARGD